MKTKSPSLAAAHNSCLNEDSHKCSRQYNDTVGPSTRMEQLSAIAWILFAWIVGTIVFELNVMGADPDSVPPRDTLLQRIDQRERDFAITHAGIDGFLRMERDAQLRSVFDAVIAQADSDLTTRKKMAEAKREKTRQHAKELAKQQAEKLAQHIKQVVHTFQEFLVPVQVAPIDAPIDVAVDAVVATQSTTETPRSSTTQSTVEPTEPAKILRVPVIPVVVPQLDSDQPVVSAGPSTPASSNSKSTTVSTTVADRTSISSTAESSSKIAHPNIEQPKMDLVVVEEIQSVKKPTPHVASRWEFLKSETPEADSVSLNVNNAEVRGVLEMLASGYQMNILTAPDVAGTVTANVSGLTPEQTLTAITKMCNLNIQRDGNLIYVYPEASLPSEARELQVFHLDFVSGESIEPIVQGLLSPVGRAFVTKVDSDDNRRSEETIVVVDIPEVILQVEQFIRQADHAPRQVMIEANILEILLSDDMRHGVDFGSILGGDLKVTGLGLAHGTASTSNPLFFAQIEGRKITSLIDVLKTTTDSKTLASPRVQVINGQNARIQVGEQLGYKVATSTQTAVIESVEFLDTGIVLTVTPTISSDNRILLKVKPEVSDGKRDPELGIPEKTTREVDTSVLLDDHQGLVIGGLIREKDETIIRKLPWLGDVRHIGKLFQRREALRSRTEIVIALTCHIVEPCTCVDDETINLERSTERLFHGRLLRNHRPWEPRLPDTAGESNWMDVETVNGYIP